MFSIKRYPVHTPLTHYKTGLWCNEVEYFPCTEISHAFALYPGISQIVMKLQVNLLDNFLQLLIQSDLQAIPLYSAFTQYCSDPYGSWGSSKEKEGNKWSCNPILNILKPSCNSKPSTFITQLLLFYKEVFHLNAINSTWNIQQ